MSEEFEGVEIKLASDSGALVFRPGGLEMFVPKFPDDLKSEDPEYNKAIQEELDSFKSVTHDFPAATFDEIVNIISYLMYALERDDWKASFIDELELVIKTASDNQAEEKRSHLRLVKNEE